MQEIELETSRQTPEIDKTRIRELETWFRFDYVERLNRIARCQYLGLPLPESRWTLELEAYEKENELRKLQGLPELPEIKFSNLL
jgi:hypothetical protein